MRLLIKTLVILTMLSSLQGCLLLNNVDAIHHAKMINPKQDRGIAIVGVAVEGVWNYPQFSLSLDEYSLEKQAITGNCWRFNRMTASVPKETKSLQYFAFDLAPGYYTYSPFNLPNPHSEQVQGFHVPAGQITYIGNFIYTENKSIELRRNYPRIEAELKQAYPNIKSTVKLAETVLVKRPHLFLCAP
jgi:hypothetical protein